MSLAPQRLAIRGLGKAFGANVVLRDLDLTLAPGEIHALIGGNGAGKSTLSKIIAGIEPRDAGDVVLDGASYRPSSRRAAQAAGVVMVLQELTVLPTLSVAENLFLGALPTTVWGAIDRSALERRAREALARVGLGSLDPATPASALGVGHQQLVEIAGGLAQQCRILILDEPTAALTGAETRTLFALLRQLREAGTTILFISHRLDEIAALADRVSVLRDGQLVATRPARETPRDELIALMAGAAAEAATARQLSPATETALRVEGLATAGLVREVSFEVRRGEILGLGGLVGAGRTELLRAIYGAAPVDAGAMFVGPEGTPFAPRRPADAVARGFAFVPEDRKHHGIFAPLSLRWNGAAANWPRRAGIAGWIDGPALVRRTDALLGELRVRFASPEQPIAELSGGNQQKIVIGRWLGRPIEVWLLDEPTRGVDVQARAAIHALLRERAAGGAAVIVASSDFEELTLLCHRVLVLSNGRTAGEFTPDRLTPEAFLAAAFSGYSGST